jgi:hypothetical protein
MDFSSGRRRQQPAARDWALFGAGALSFLLSVGVAWQAWREARAGQAQLSVLRSERDEAAARVRALETSLRRDSMATQAWLTVEAPPPRVVADLAELLPPEVRLEELSLRYGTRLEVAMTVAARRAPAYDLFLERLAASPRFADVVPGSESRGDEVRAELRAAYREEAP